MKTRILTRPISGKRDLRPGNATLAKDRAEVARSMETLEAFIERHNRTLTNETGGGAGEDGGSDRQDNPDLYGFDADGETSLPSLSLISQAVSRLDDAAQRSIRRVKRAQQEQSVLQVRSVDDTPGSAPTSALT